MDYRIDIQAPPPQQNIFAQSGNSKNVFGNPLVIATGAANHSIAPGLGECIVVSNFTRAKRFLKSSFNNGKKSPALIIINLPFNKEQTEKFTSFLKRRNWSSTIPVIYHEAALTSKQLEELSGLNLVDDVMEIESYKKDLLSKVNFLRKAKTFLSADTVDKVSTSVIKSKQNFVTGFHFITRRLLDIFIAAIILVFVSPLMILIMLFIKAESRGPVIYKSKRAGRGCRIFNFYKFRTMLEGAEKELPAISGQNLYNSDIDQPHFFKVLNDPRITLVGKFLRNTSLDELPQLINVIKGDMSLVGNRPLPLYEASTLTTNAWAERFMAPAGMTGLWQILKRGTNNISVEDRLNLDINYARDNSIGRDLWILANTPRALFQKVSV